MKSEIRNQKLDDNFKFRTSKFDFETTEGSAL